GSPGEYGEPDLIDGLAPEGGPEPAGKRQDHDERDQVGRRDPGRLGHRDPEAGLDMRECHVDNGDVDRPHKRAEGDRRGDEPLVGRRVGRRTWACPWGVHQRISVPPTWVATPRPVVSTVASTERPTWRLSGASSSVIRTGSRCTTFVKLPVAFCGGRTA